METKLRPVAGVMYDGGSVGEWVMAGANPPRLQVEGVPREGRRSRLR